MVITHASSGPATPTRLGDLPVELLDQIISDALPEGFESLALSCKTMHQRCKPYIGHHNLLRSQFDRFCYKADPRPLPVAKDPLWRSIQSAFDLLERIAAEPIVARYIRHANLGDDSYPPFFSQPPRVPDLDDGGPVLELLAGSPHLKRAGVDHRKYYSRIAEAYDRSNPVRFSQDAAAFVLTLLPNIKSLCLPQYWEPTEETGKLVDMLVSDARLPRTPQQRPSSLALVARLDSYDRGYAVDDFGKLRPFLCLPEVRTLHCDRSSTSSPHPHPHPEDAVRGPSPPGFAGKLEHAHFHNFLIDDAPMATFLRNAEHLQTLIFSHYPPSDPGESLPPWDICSLLRTVQCEAGSRLERLSVETEDIELVPGLVPMRQFYRLRDLVLPLEIFRGHASAAIATRRLDKSVDDLTDEDVDALGLRLGDLIPDSLAQLYLLSPGHAGHVKVLQFLFRDFGALRATRLPALEKILLQCPEDYDADLFADPAYRGKCESLVSETEPIGVTVELETYTPWPTDEWPGGERFEEYVRRVN